MRLNQYTVDELLKLHEPQTDLEKELARRIFEYKDECERAVEDLKFIDDHECVCDEEEERITYLEEVLDQNGIKYNK